MNTLRITGLACWLLLPLLGCQREPAEDAPSSESAAVVPVEISNIREGDISLTLQAVGQTEALRKETVLSPVAGTLASLKVLEGTAVKLGDTLAVLWTKESQAAVTGARVLLAAATTPEQRQEAERALELARSSQTLLSIESSLSGIVSSRQVVEGSLLAEGSELLTVIDPASIEFVAQVPLKDLALLALSQHARVAFTSVDGVTYDAIVSAISPGSDPQTQTVRVRLSFVNVTPQQRVFMKDGITGAARIVAAARTHVLLVPTRALLRNDDNDTYTIVTVTSDSLSRSVPIVVGTVDDTTAEISGAGLHPGMSVVVAGHYALVDSTRVSVVTRNQP